MLYFGLQVKDPVVIFTETVNQYLQIKSPAGDEINYENGTALGFFFIYFFIIYY